MNNRENKRFIPKWVKASFLLLILSTFIYILAINNISVADFVNDTVSVVLRAFASYVTYLLPFSLFEVLIILLPLIIVLLLVLFFKGAKTARSRSRVIFSLVGVVSLILSSYIFMLGIGYRTTPMSQKIGIEDSSDILTEDLYNTTVTVRDQVNSLSELISYENGESIMPYSIDKLSEKIVSAYGVMNDEYSILTNFTSRAKPVHFSTVMSDLRISGIYSFFTGEANVNTEYPDYNLPFTVAHELAHQRGICRENEANFTAFLVCIASDDAFIRYSGYLNLYEYLSSALYRADSDLYYEVRDGLSDSAALDIAASNAVYRAHEDSFLGELNDRINDNYLKLNGTQGTVTYGYVVRLAVGYYKNGAK